ncbi:hypothetical protein [Tepidiphilus margaritifer]|uniref:hypothetical protein n=1 Tax=Tepidiphilus margaritifer TaxID=203471 RepID=UPI00048AA506|nr:hypothetical protein [Tepidiphilus margaritifer]
MFSLIFPTRKNISKIAGIDNAKAIAGNVIDFHKANRKALRRLIAEAKRKDSQNDNTISHEELMAEWGIHEGNRKLIIRNLRLTQFLLAFAILFVFYNYATLDFRDVVISKISITFLFIVSLIYGMIQIALAQWRIEMIKTQSNYQPFIAWLTAKS